MAARIDPNYGVKQGDTVRLCLDAEKLLIFDVASGAYLTGDSGSE